MEEIYVHNYYDTKNGWEQTNPGWYEIVTENTDPHKHLKMIEWLYKNIDLPERHARWIYSDTSIFKFRYERDYIWFRLTW